MRNILLAATLLLALAMALQTSEAARNRGRRRGNNKNGHMEVTCAQIKPEDICNHTSNSTKGFQVFDGCNVCTCGRQPGKMLCSIKSCPRQDKIQDGSPTKDRVDRFCTNLGRKVHRKLGRFIKKKAKKASKSRRSWPIKCFKERRLCRDRPGAAFFDGCNRCRCPDSPGAGAAAAQCESANDCPQFYGTRRQFKRRCRQLGANIEGDERRQGRRRGRRRGNRRRQKKQQAVEDSGVSLMQRLLSRF